MKMKRNRSILLGISPNHIERIGKSHEIKFLQLTKDNEWQKKILTHVKAVYKSCNELEIGYEFIVKAELSHLLATIKGRQCNFIKDALTLFIC